MNVYVYHTSPNQKTVVTQKAVSDKEHKYGVFNLDATLSAAKVLTDRAFKLYVRMNLHQNGHTYALSPVEIQKTIGMTDKRYRDAVKELISKGFLVQDEKHSSLYRFYESPPQARVIAPEWTDDPLETVVSSGENGRMTPPEWTGNPSKSGGEIVHNITSHSTKYNTSYNNKGANNLNSFGEALDNFGKPGFFDGLDNYDLPF